MEGKVSYYVYRLTHINTGVFYYAVTIDELSARKRLRDNLQSAITAKAKPELKSMYDKLIQLNVVKPKATMKVDLSEWVSVKVFGPHTFPTCHAIRKEFTFVMDKQALFIPQMKH